jgi:hypothetical protein
MAEQASVIAQIEALKGMTVSQLRLKWRELYGDDTRSCNRVYLWRRLAWRVQELAYGGLSERAKARLAELNRDDDLRMLPPRGWKNALEAVTARASNAYCGPVKDPRLPKPGAVLSRQYRGHDIQVTVSDKGFDWEGRPYRSLSAVAHAVTGQKWNGLLFFGLTNRKGRS